MVLLQTAIDNVENYTIKLKTKRPVIGIWIDVTLSKERQTESLLLAKSGIREECW